MLQGADGCDWLSAVRAKQSSWGSSLLPLLSISWLPQEFFLSGEGGPRAARGEGILSPDKRWRPHLVHKSLVKNIGRGGLSECGSMTAVPGVQQREHGKTIEEARKSPAENPAWCPLPKHILKAMAGESRCGGEGLLPWSRRPLVAACKSCSSLHRPAFPHRG